MRITKKLVIIIAAVIALPGIAFHSLAPAQENAAYPNECIRPSRRDILQYVTATGIVKPRTGAEVRVGAQVSGVVSQLFVSIGQRVKKGDVLAEIDPSVYRSKYDMARANLQIAETEKNYASVELRRSGILLESGAITKQQYEAAEKVYALAASQTEVARADLNYAALELGYTRIVAPISGIVSSVSTQKGETVTANFSAPTFVTIIDLDRLELWAYVDETDIGRIRKEQKVSFTVDTYPGEEFSGIVQAVYPKAEIQNNVVNYIAVIRINNDGTKTIRPEMTANIKIAEGRRENILAIPKRYVKRQDGEAYVNLLINGKPEKRSVITGASDGRYVEVVSGISASDRIISGFSKIE